MHESIFFEELSQTVVDTKGVQQFDDFSFPLHLHSQPEFFMILSGEMQLLSVKKILLRAGDAVLISPLVIHGYESNGPVSFCSMVFEDSLFSDIKNMEEFTSGSYISMFGTKAVFPGGELDDAFCGVLRYRERNHLELLRLYCRILLTLVLEYSFSDAGRQEMITTDDKDLVSQFMQGGQNGASAVQAYIQAHYREKITLNDLARAINSNRYTVSRSLNDHFHATLSEIVNRYRIQEACSLLRRTSDSIQKIAERVGYDTVSTFNRNFLRYMEETPREFRQKARGITVM